MKNSDTIEESKKEVPDNHAGSTVQRDEKGRWLSGQSANPAGRPKGKTISELIRARLEDPQEGKEFVDMLFKMFKEEKRLAAGIEILNRNEGKVKDHVQIERLSDHVPDMEEQERIRNMFPIEGNETKT